jgi:hypothetical protein
MDDVLDVGGPELWLVLALAGSAVALSLAHAVRSSPRTLWASLPVSMWSLVAGVFLATAHLIGYHRLGHAGLMWSERSPDVFWPLYAGTAGFAASALLIAVGQWRGLS